MSNKLKQYYNNALQLTNGLETPKVAEMQLELQQYVQQGLLTPEEANAILVQNSAMEGVEVDPSVKQSQLDALQTLQTTVDSGGLDAQAKARLNDASNQLMTEQKGAREAITANANARGVGGSGMELANALLNNQASSQRSNQAGFDIASEGERRKQEALMQLLNGTSNYRNQDFMEKESKARAQDTINQFNAQNQQQVGMVNTAAKNNAQATNLQNTQNIANANADQRNQQQQYNKQLKQQDFENKYKKVGMQTNILTGQGNATQDQSNADRQNTQQMVGTALTAAAMFSDEKLKKDVEEFDATKFLDSITGYKYKYKKPEMGEGKQVGVLAQDVEKEAPNLVKETAEGKVIDFNKSGGVLFAALANLNERLNKIEE